jgi:hypothetical protein
MAVLRRAQFYSAAITTTGWSTAYTVPTGHRIVLRNILIMNNAGAAKLCGVRIQGPIPLWVPNVAAGATAQLTLEAVLGPGQVLEVNGPTGGNTTYVLSGYIFFV